MNTPIYCLLSPIYCLLSPDSCLLNSYFAPRKFVLRKSSMKVRLTSSQKIKVSGSADIYAIMRDVLLRERKIDRSKEHFWIVCLAHNNKLLLIELISFGSATRTVVEPTEVFSFALQKKASQLIMVHYANHSIMQIIMPFFMADVD